MNFFFRSFPLPFFFTFNFVVFSLLNVIDISFLLPEHFVSIWGEGNLTEVSVTALDTSIYKATNDCSMFSTKSSLLIEKPLSTAAWPWDKVKKIWKTFQSFAYLGSFMWFQ